MEQSMRKRRTAPGVPLVAKVICSFTGDDERILYATHFSLVDVFGRCLSTSKTITSTSWETL